MINDLKQLYTKYQFVLKYSSRLLIPVLFFCFVFTVIKPADILQVFSKIQWERFFLGWVCIAFVNLLCSLRTRDLLFDKSQHLAILWHIHSLRTLILGVLPFSTGELSYVYYLKKYCSTSVTNGLAALLSVRLLEFIFFLILLFFLAICGTFIEQSKLSWAALGTTGVFLCVVLLFVFKSSWVTKVITKAIDLFLVKFVSKERSERILEKILNFSIALKNVLSSKNRTNLFVLTICIVVFRIVFVLSMISAMGVQITVQFIVYLFVFLFMARFFQGFGSLGSQEASISGALMLMGQTTANALAISIGAHMLQWIPILFMGGISYTYIQWIKHKKSILDG